MKFSKAGFAHVGHFEVSISVVVVRRVGFSRIDVGFVGGAASRSEIVGNVADWAGSFTGVPSPWLATCVCSSLARAGVAISLAGMLFVSLIVSESSGRAGVAAEVVGGVTTSGWLLEEGTISDSFVPLARMLELLVEVVEVWVERESMALSERLLSSSEAMRAEAGGTGFSIYVDSTADGESSEEPFLSNNTI